MKGMIIAAALALTSISAQAADIDVLSNYASKNRVLVLFGTSGDAKLAQQVKQLRSEKAQLADRDMVVFTVVGDEVRPVFGDASKIDAHKLRQEANIDSGAFQAVLVGKDGGVKLRSQNVVSNSDMFGLIDRMPMRKTGN